MIATEENGLFGAKFDCVPKSLKFSFGENTPRLPKMALPSRAKLQIDRSTTRKCCKRPQQSIFGDSRPGFGHCGTSPLTLGRKHDWKPHPFGYHYAQPQVRTLFTLSKALGLTGITSYFVMTYNISPQTILCFTVRFYLYFNLKIEC